MNRSGRPKGTALSKWFIVSAFVEAYAERLAALRSKWDVQGSLKSSRFQDLLANQEFQKDVEASNNPLGLSLTEIIRRSGCAKGTALSRLKELVRDNGFTKTKKGKMQLYTPPSLDFLRSYPYPIRLLPLRRGRPRSPPSQLDSVRIFKESQNFKLPPSDIEWLKKKGAFFKETDQGDILTGFRGKAKADLKEMLKQAREVRAMESFIKKENRRLASWRKRSVDRSVVQE